MSDQEDPAIIVDSVSKSFLLPHEKSTSIKSLIINPFRKRTYENQQVLKDVSFEIGKGEFFGIVGRNGSGKSTLLKILAQIYQPSGGGVEVEGSLVPFIELGVGFNPELTGKDNIYLNGVMLGFSRKEISETYDEIVAFAELENFMDQKLKNYSSGMQVRLAFSIAIQAKADILLIDEVLAVGDSSFQRKCFNYFANLKDDNTTVVFVSHDMDAIQRFCDRAALIDGGELVKVGETDEITDIYYTKNESKTVGKTKEATDDDGDGSAEIKDVKVIKNGKTTESYSQSDEHIQLQAKIVAKQEIQEDTLVGITLRRSGTGDVFWTNSDWLDVSIGPMKKGEHKYIELSIENVLADGQYFAQIAFRNLLKNKTFARRKDVVTFAVQRRGKNKWLLHPKHSLKIK